MKKYKLFPGECPPEPNSKPAKGYWGEPNSKQKKLSEKLREVFLTENSFERRKKKIAEILENHPDDKNLDLINKPPHYTQGIECIDYVESHKMDFCQGNAIKYLTRFRHKNGIEDLKKALWYVQRLIYQEEQKNG